MLLKNRNGVIDDNSTLANTKHMWAINMTIKKNCVFSLEKLLQGLMFEKLKYKTMLQSRKRCLGK